MNSEHPAHSFQWGKNTEKHSIFWKVLKIQTLNSKNVYNELATLKWNSVNKVESGQ